MTSREIILANFANDAGIRPGMDFDRGRMNDLFYGGAEPYGYTQRRWTEGSREYYDDPWGNIWVRMKDGCQKGEIYKQALDNWDNLDSMTWPDFSADSCYKAVRADFAADSERFHIFCLPGWIFERSRYLRRLDEYFIDMIENPEKLHVLHNKLADIFSGIIVKAAEIGADAIFFCEDMGTQKGLFFSAAMWREFFGAIYRRLFGMAHDCGMKVMMHSCGYNWDILPDLIAAGVDCFQFDQPLIYDTKKLALLLKQHKKVLWSPVDIQKVMPTGNRELIESAAREMVRAYRGGLICKNYTDLAGIGVKKEWDEWAYDAICHEAGIN
ncbi:MAG TPA: uroporphyrinogen decarboxylase family protein [Phycisphaerae bacterium]|nr:uroporphyrinogen decarboxylase family protein [Phycisphaerae bacterium]